jgi:hypothetical protein
MTANVQQQFLNHGPMAVLVGSMVLVGSLVNQDATVSTLYPQENWCNNATAQLQHFITAMPKGLGAATIVVVVIFPLVPMLINSETKTWNDFKIDILKCHVVGQTSVFGVSELLRHFLVSPEPTFLKTCNITAEECIVKSHVSSANVSFCNTNATTLFDSLHHFPDKTCCIIGASIVTFLATLYYWNKINKNGKSIYEAHSFKQCFLIFVQILCLTLILTYMYFLYNTFDGVQLYGLIIGAILQCMVILSSIKR